jgi:hypothetical protein
MQINRVLIMIAAIVVVAGLYQCRQHYISFKILETSNSNHEDNIVVQSTSTCVSNADCSSGYCTTSGEAANTCNATCLTSGYCGVDGDCCSSNCPCPYGQCAPFQNGFALYDLGDYAYCQSGCSAYNSGLQPVCASCSSSAYCPNLPASGWDCTTSSSSQSECS